MLEFSCLAGSPRLKLRIGVLPARLLKPLAAELILQTRRRARIRPISAPWILLVKQKTGMRHRLGVRLLLGWKNYPRSHAPWV